MIAAQRYDQITGFFFSQYLSPKKLLWMQTELLLNEGIQFVNNYHPSSLSTDTAVSDELFIWVLYVYILFENYLHFILGRISVAVEVSNDPKELQK